MPSEYICCEFKQLRYCVADRDADITYDLTTSKKSKNMVKVMFRANPKPTSGIWQKKLIIQSIDLSKTLTILMLQKKKFRVREN